MPAVSVLVPVWNAAPWLDASLASLWRQSHRDFEVIAVDDGSSDGSGDTLERIAAREPRLRVIHTPHRGLPAALATGLAAASGPLIARHDADDLSHRERLTLQHAALAADPQASVIGCRVRALTSAGTPVGPGMRRWIAWHNGLVSHEAMACEALIDSPLAHGTALIRRAALDQVGGWRERGWPEDLDLWLRMLAAGHRFAKLPRTLYAWRQHPASATRRDPRYRRAAFTALKRDALERGLLRGAPRVSLIGVGRSLAAWQAALAPVREVQVISAGRPDPRRLPTLATPLLLVFGAAPARRRWRAALHAAELHEGSDFAFIA